MKLQYLLAGCFAASLFFVACGDDSSSGNGVDREDVSSSSVKDKSSSSKAVSSSSKKQEDGSRAATLDDLAKNMILNIDGHEVHLSTGIKEGLFSFWVLGSKAGEPDTGKVIAISDFENGEISLSSENTATSVISTLDEDYFLYKMAEQKKISFIVDSTKTLLYSVDGGKKKEVLVEQVALGKSTINKMEELVGKAITCKSGDTTDVYKFFNGRFVINHSEGKKEYIAGGYADIQRGTLFMLPEFYNWRLMQVYSLSVSSSFDLGLGECSVDSFKVSTIKPSNLENSWYSYDKEANVDWTLKLNKDKTFDLRGNNGEAVFKTGDWDIYGNVLFLGPTACNDPETCERAIGGAIEDFEKDKGFTYKHGNKEKPALPTEWVVPEFE